MNTPMQAFLNLRIGVRLGLAFAVVLALLVTVAGVGLLRLSNLHDQLTLVVENRYPKVLLAVDVKNDVGIVALNLRSLLSDGQGERRRKAEDAIAAARGRLDESMNKLDRTLQAPETRRILDKLKERRAAFVADQGAFGDFVLAGNVDGATALMNGAMGADQRACEASIDELVAALSAQFRQAGEEGSRAHETGRMLMLLLSAGAFAAAVLMAWLVTRSITRPIARAVRAAQTVAAGDLTSAIQVETRDESGQLLQALKEMNASLVRVVGEVRHSSDSIATGSGQIATGNQDLSQRTEEQASNLQQTAASMEELTGNVCSSADIASSASRLASDAQRVATEGGEMVDRVVVTMADITGSSRKIESIIGVIDGVAFQTNILALNAAVEAARAGEHGRGFAVVASEVRGLAQRSANAAREIKVLINDSVTRVAAGSELVGKAGGTMRDIVTQVRKVNEMLAEISAAAREQTSGLGQINNAVGQLDQVTQQNAALVEESAAAAESLRQQAARLVAAVAAFRVSS
ncbi:MAG: methyl-accepting chemotaxis protein [Vitreoscilla sp.]